VKKDDRETPAGKTRPGEQGFQLATANKRNAKMEQTIGGRCFVSNRLGGMTEFEF